MKRVNIKCPYCGARAFLRPASVVYGERAAPGSKLYVCGNYPACDSYVAAHRTSQFPMGTLADKQLRRERQAAHAVFNQLWKSGPDVQAAGLSLAPGEAGSSGMRGPYCQVFRGPLSTGH